MKPIYILALAGLAIGGAYLYLRSRQPASADVGSSTPSPDNVEPLTVLLPAGQGGSTGGSSAPPEAGSETQGLTTQSDPNAAAAQVEEVNTGFQPVDEGQPIPTIPLNFLTTQVNPFTGQEQAIFQRIDDKGVPAAAGFKLPGGDVAFIEQLPQGAASTAPNVVYLSQGATAASIGQHQAKSAFSSKPGDANYDSKVASAYAAYASNPTAENSRAYVQAIKDSRNAPAATPAMRAESQVLASLSASDPRRKGVEKLAATPAKKTTKSTTAKSLGIKSIGSLLGAR